VKRDTDYIRTFLLECEADENCYFMCHQTGYYEGKFVDVLPSGWDWKKNYHYILLQDADFVVELDDKFDPPSTLEESNVVSVGKFRITNAGHDYLDAIRDDNIWEKTKTAVSEAGGNVTLEVIKLLAVGFAKQQLEKQTGIKL